MSAASTSGLAVELMLQVIDVKSGYPTLFILKDIVTFVSCLVSGTVSAVAVKTNENCKNDHVYALNTAMATPF